MVGGQANYCIADFRWQIVDWVFEIGNQQSEIGNNNKAVHDFSWTASVDCWDWPELTVCNFQKGGARCSKTSEPKS